MEIITNLSTLGICGLELEPGDQDTENVCAAIRRIAFRNLSDAYIDATNDSDVFFYDDYSPERFHFGALEPEYIKLRVEAWIPEIKKEFVDAYNALCGEHVPGELSDDSILEMDSTKTYRMANAARELDNAWHCYSAHAVYLENDCGYPYFKVHLTDEEKADILNHPGEYIIFDAQIKG